MVHFKFFKRTECNSSISCIILIINIKYATLPGMTWKRFLFVWVLFLIAYPAYAGVVISEIMYDLEGADTGREWVEIKNEGPDAVDLTGWKFFEAGINHGLTLIQGSVSISQNSFAIIADNAEKFLLDWPGFSGTLFDSSFSFSNSGETIALRNSELVDIDKVSYLSDWGAAGDKNSLQKVSGEWVASIPTLGLEGEKKNTGNTLEPNFPEENSAVNSGSIPEPKKAPFSVYAGEDKSALAGAEIYFEGEVVGISEDMAGKIRFLWNFGDGTTGEGKNLKHVFQYPGSYIVTVNASLGADSGSDSLKVSATSAGIFVSEIKPGGWVEIKNESTKISDVSGFGIQINNSIIFNFPKDTKLSANSFLTLDTPTLGFEIPDIGEIKILYPNGKILFSSKYEAKSLNEKESVSFDEETWKKSEATPGAKNVVKNIVNQNIVSAAGIIPPPNPPPLTVRGGGSEGGGVTDSVVKNNQASAVTTSLWSEIKWLIFGLLGGVLLGAVYIFISKRVFTVKKDTPTISNSRE